MSRSSVLCGSQNIVISGKVYKAISYRGGSRGSNFQRGFDSLILPDNLLFKSMKMK